MTTTVPASSVSGLFAGTIIFILLFAIENLFKVLYFFTHAQSVFLFVALDGVLSPLLFLVQLIFRCLSISLVPEATY